MKRTKTTRNQENKWHNFEILKKWAIELNRGFSKGEFKMTKKYWGKYSISLAVMEMEIKTTLRFQLKPLRMAKIKKTPDNKHWTGHGKPSFVVEVIAEWCSHYISHGDQSQKASAFDPQM